MEAVSILLLPLPAPQKVIRFQVSFLIQILSSKWLR